MSINYTMAVDPGMATGVAIGRHSVDMPLDVIFVGIIGDGVQGFCEWLYRTRDGKAVVEADCSRSFPEDYATLNFHLDVVSENFKLRNNKFAANLEPLRIEGVLIDHFGNKVSWQSPADKSIVGDEFLKKNDLWQTGKNVGHEDGRDANDALLHLFANAMRTRHIPTLEAYWR